MIDGLATYGGKIQARPVILHIHKYLRTLPAETYRYPGDRRLAGPLPQFRRLNAVNDSVTQHVLKRR